MSDSAAHQGPRPRAYRPEQRRQSQRAFTDRNAEIMRLADTGLGVREIARQLCLRHQIVSEIVQRERGRRSS